MIMYEFSIMLLLWFREFEAKSVCALQAASLNFITSLVKKDLLTIEVLVRLSFRFSIVTFCLIELISDL